MGENRKNEVRFIDYEFLIILVFLTCFGLIMLYSATSHTVPLAGRGASPGIFKKQVVFALSGFAGMFVISLIDYHFYGKIAVFIYALSLVFMFLVKTPLGYDDGSGVTRSLRILPGITFEPSEIGKICVIILTAAILCRTSEQRGSVKIFIMALALSVFTGLWVKYFTTNLSTAIIIAAIPVFLLFVAYPRIWPFLLLTAAILTMAAGVIKYAVDSTKEEKDPAAAESYQSAEEREEDKKGKKSYQFERIRAWVQGAEDVESAGTYQVRQGMYAIGSGGFWGKGLGRGTQKLGAVPLVQNDMILTVICEELGIFGAILIMTLFGYLLFRLVFIARNAPDMFGSFIAAGVFIHIALQVILNVAVVTNLLPTTGVTLPFFSSGGSALMTILGEMGIVWGISRKIVLE